MEQANTETAALADPTDATIASDHPPTKPRRPRRMAREPDAGSPPLAGTSTSASAPPAPRKIDGVIALLRRTEGATLAEMTGATGWLPHTARAALTGLRKKGHAVVKAKRGDATCYHLAETH